MDLMTLRNIFVLEGGKVALIDCGQAQLNEASPPAHSVCDVTVVAGGSTLS